jgi:hypothetical protein
MKRIFSVLLISILTITGCKEVFYPSISGIDRMLVVEGLITSESGPYRIRLSYSADYYSTSVSEPVENARVIVFDDSNTEYEYTEIRPGIYISPVELQGVVGNTYTLEVSAENGLTYRSNPQTILPPYSINSLQAESAIRTSVRESNSGSLVVTEINGVEALAQLDKGAQNLGNIRFETSVIILYSYEGGTFFDPIRFYCWRELTRFEGINNINKPTTSNQPGDVSNNVVGFFPYDKSVYFLEESEDLLNLIVGVKVYSINEDAYSYYLDVNKQLNSDGSLFAPIPSQIKSNIYCVTDNSIPALGLFEASSYSFKGFVLRKPPLTEHLTFEYTDKYSLFPTAGCYSNEKPPFWVD